MKNVEPNTESDIEKGASIYSNPCSIENSIPNRIVINKEIVLVILFFFK